MRKTVCLIFLYLLTPALCQGYNGREPRLDYPEVARNVYSSHKLVFDHRWPGDDIELSTLSVDTLPDGFRMISLRDINGGIPGRKQPAPGDMVSMMSFVWAEVFGGVDVVAEVKEFARQIRQKNRSKIESPDGRHTSSGRWKFIIACRLDAQTEVAAQFNDIGSPFSREQLALVINTLDPVSREIGLTMSFSQGVLNLRADRMTLADAAEAKLLVKF